MSVSFIFWLDTTMGCDLSKRGIEVMRAVSLLLGLVLILSGCSQMKPGGTTIPNALAGIQSDIAFSGAMSVSGSPNWTVEETDQFNASVQASQCQQHRADPTVVSMIGDLTMTLTGSYTTSGQFTIGSMTTSPTVGFTSSAGRTIGQQLEIPVTFVVLSSLPDSVLMKRLTAVRGTMNEKPAFTEAQYDALASQYWTEHDDLVGRIKLLIAAYTPTQCSNKTPAVLFGNHR